MRKLLVVLVLAFGVGIAADDANAQFCPGVVPWVFDDILASDPSCPNITELAQRGVTLGCVIIDANHRLYCPSDYVTRVSMANFMVRLADSILPLTCAVGQVMKWDGVNWVCSNDNSGNPGTVTSVATGAGLTGGPITTTGTISIANGGVTQPMLSAAGGTNGQVLSTNGTALQWTTPPTIPAILPITGGGTGAADAAGARGNLGLGSLAVGAGAGTVNYVPKVTVQAPYTLGNSQIQDNGTSIAMGSTTPNIQYQLYVYRQQLTINGDGQSTIYGYRTRDSQNDGINYSQLGNNRAVEGFNFWGDVYTFGVDGHKYNDYSRTGGTLGADVNGAYWGSLGYRSSGLLNYGVYGSSGYASGGGDPAEAGRAALAVSQEGIGGGFFGGMVGTWSSGNVMGHVSSGEMFASYNIGNVYTSGATANVVTLSKANSAGAERAAAYAVTSPELKVYDNGVGTMSAREVFVPFASNYAGMLASAPTVTVSPVGAPVLLYIKSVSTDGFTVASSASDQPVQFHWIAVGSRVDAMTNAALPADLASKDFDANLKAAMSTDGNLNKSAKPMWWDGNKVRFDKPPAQVQAAKVEKP